jgi:hypothetical protein
MKHDPLVEMLREADAAAPPPPFRHGLADAVRRRARRRHRRRLAGAGIVVAAFVACALVVRQPGATPTALVEIPTTGPTTSVAALRAQADVQWASLQRLRQVERTRQRMHRIEMTLRAAAPSPQSTAVERERAALILLDHGDRLRRDLRKEDAARSAYRRTIELFPDTRWAAVARERMEQMAT